MNIEELTIKDLKELCKVMRLDTAETAELKRFDPSHPWQVGENYFIRTVTHHLTGKLVAVHEQELVLVNAAWIADDGRFSDAVAKSDFSEVEPFPVGRLVIVGRASLIDAVIVDKLPTSQK